VAPDVADDLKRQNENSNAERLVVLHNFAENVRQQSSIAFSRTDLFWCHFGVELAIVISYSCAYDARCRAIYAAFRNI